MSSSNFHRPWNACTVISNTPFERFETSIARWITAIVSSETTTGLSPAAVLIRDRSESGSHVVISLSRRFISPNIASAAFAASASLSVQNQTDTFVPIALS